MATRIRACPRAAIAALMISADFAAAARPRSSGLGWIEMFGSQSMAVADGADDIELGVSVMGVTFTRKFPDAGIFYPALPESIAPFGH